MSTSASSTDGPEVGVSLDEGLVLHEGGARRDFGDCYVGGTCTPEEPDGTDDGFSTCTGCNNDVWVGYNNEGDN